MATVHFLCSTLYLFIFLISSSGLTSVTPTLSKQTSNKVCVSASACRRWFPPLVVCVPLGSAAQTDHFFSPKKQTKWFVCKLKWKCYKWRPIREQSGYNLTTPHCSFIWVLGNCSVAVFVCQQLLSLRTKKQALKMPHWKKSRWNKVGHKGSSCSLKLELGTCPNT